MNSKKLSKVLEYNVEVSGVTYRVSITIKDSYIDKDRCDKPLHPQNIAQIKDIMLSHPQCSAIQAMNISSKQITFQYSYDI